MPVAPRSSSSPAVPSTAEDPASSASPTTTLPTAAGTRRPSSRRSTPSSEAVRPSSPTSPGTSPRPSPTKTDAPTRPSASTTLASTARGSSSSRSHHCAFLRSLVQRHPLNTSGAPLTHSNVPQPQERARHLCVDLLQQTRQPRDVSPTLPIPLTTSSIVLKNRLRYM